MEIEEQLAALVDDPRFQEIDHHLRKFNLFEAIGAVRGELRHSNFLAFVLSPARPHGLGTELLLLVLRAILAKVPADRRDIRALELIVADLDRTVVHRERDNIDLLIDVKELRLIVTIENKIDAQVGKDQLNIYKAIVRRKFPNHRFLFVLLTPQGIKPKDPDYVAFSYSELADIIDALARDRAETLSDEMVLILRHYVRMLRRNIVEDERLADLAIRLYEKHKEAFDFVRKHQPEPKNLLDDIRGLITSNVKLTEDKHIESLLRFAPLEWASVPQLNSCAPAEWTRTGRSLLFEVKASEEGRIIIALVLGPSTIDGLRERIYSEATKNKELFVGLVKPMRKKWSTIFSIELLTTMDALDMGHEEQVEAIGVAWQNFLDRNLPALTTAIVAFR